MLRLKSALPGTVTLIICTSCGGGSSSSGSSTATPSSSAETGSTEINDNDPSIIFSRGNKTTQDWDSIQGASEDYKQDEHSSSLVRSGGAVTGAGVVVSFTGTGISWIGKKGPQYGIAAYSIDGGAPKSVDNYNSKAEIQNTNVTVSGLSSESHVLSISLIDKKNGASSDYGQTIDAFAIEGSTLTPSQGTLAGYNSPDLKFTGTWGRIASPEMLPDGTVVSSEMLPVATV